MARSRLQRELRDLCKDPIPHIVARPSLDDIRDWHYVLEGYEGTPFAGGYYYGMIMFPPDYPYNPPRISIATPNGRFMTQEKICLSMSDSLPESWNPMWRVSSILLGLLSFMAEDTFTTGSVTTTDEEKQRLAKASLAFNCQIPTFENLFPEYVEKFKQRLAEQAQSVAVSAAPAQEDTSVLIAGPDNNRNEEEDVANARPEAQRRNDQRQSVLTWVVFSLIFLVVGAVITVLLLQL